MLVFCYQRGCKRVPQYLVINVAQTQAWVCKRFQRVCKRVPGYRGIYVVAKISHTEISHYHRDYKHAVGLSSGCKHLSNNACYKNGYHMQ